MDNTINAIDKPWEDAFLGLISPWWQFTGFEWEHVKVDITLLCWGAGFDLGYVHRLAVSLWIGPIYIEIGGQPHY